MIPSQLSELTKDQKVVVEAHAILSTGRKACQMAAGHGMRLSKIILLLQSAGACDGCGQCVEECPRTVLEVDGGRVVVIEGRSKNVLFVGCVNEHALGSGIGEEPAIRVSSDKERFIFVVEGDGSLPVKESY